MKNKTAFSLVELSVVLVVIAVLISTSMPIATSVILNYKNRITNERIQAIYKALGNFTKNYQRLPCPASMQLAKGNSNYGKEIDCSASGSAVGAWSSSANTNVIYGMIPTAALGLSSDMAEDGFGTKLAYVVIKGYANQSYFGTADSSTLVGNGSGASFNAGDGSDDNRIRVHEKLGSSYKRLTASAVMLIISYGANQNCGFNSKLTTQNSVSSDSDELLNCVRSLDSSAGVASFYNYNYSTSTFPFLASSINNENFDDIVFYKTRNQLVADFNLYDLIYCSSDATQSITYNSSTSFYWYGTTGANLNTKYGNIVLGSPLDSGNSATTACPSGYRRGPTRPSKRCGRFGVWESDVISNCVQYTQP
jgi:prepilin-type N-terminal cleavage/methylation domain-containing protein